MSLFANLAQLAEDLSTEPSRLKKRVAIAAAIRTIVALPTTTPYPPNSDTDLGAPDLSPLEIGVPQHSVDAHALHDAGLFCLYLAGTPFPEADPRKLNTGGAILTRALQQLSHCTGATLTAAYRRHGDLGAAAFDLLRTTAPTTPTFTLDELSNAFDTLAAARTTAARSSTLLDILRRATPLEAKYLLKLMLGDMRIGVKQSLIEEAIAAAAATDATADEKANSITPAAVRHAVMLEADLARAVTMAFTNTLADARMTLFHPLGFMLASPVDTPEEAIARFTPTPPKPAKPPKKSRKKSDSAPGPTSDPAISPERPAPHSVISSERPAPHSVISTEAQRSGETPVFCDAETFDTLPINHAEGPPPTAQKIHAYLEDKYDGMRAQLHCGDPAQPNRIALYSRNREDITHSFPELTEAFANITTALILDGEILAWNIAANKALPFAILAQRIGRKKIDDTLRQQIPVIFMAFDILFHNGDLLLDHPLHTRRTLLETLTTQLTPLTTSPLTTPQPELPQLTLFPTANDCHLDRSEAQWRDPRISPQPGTNFAGPETYPPQIPRLRLSPATLVTTADAIDRAYTDARSRANEGVMLKAADPHYLPGRRGLSWLKLKRELATLDVVITAAEFGHGKRAGLLSDYTFAVLGPASHNEPAQLLNIGKAYSGLTDAEILSLTAWLKAHTLEDHGHSRIVEPLRVLEVAFNNIMRSSRHASGFALRFPRILRLRDDKPVTEIDTLTRVEEIYQSQPDRPAET